MLNRAEEIQLILEGLKRQRETSAQTVAYYIRIRRLERNIDYPQSVPHIENVKRISGLISYYEGKLIE